MNRRKINGLFSILMTCLFLGLIIDVNNVNAGGGATGGTVPAGGSCGDGTISPWWDTCFGFSWQKYLVTKDFGNNDIYFPYTTNTGGKVSIQGCKKDQYIYNYGFEAYYPIEEE